MADLFMLNLDGSALTCLANDTIEAGEFVRPLSTMTDKVTSAGVSSFVPADLTVEVCDAATDYPYVIGIAAEGATTGEYFTVYTEGLFIVQSSETITPGRAVQFTETATEEDHVDMIDDAAYAGDEIGRALTGASADAKYLLIKLSI